MDHAVVQIVMRYLHVVSAIVAVGGWAFMALCLTPATRLLDESLRGSVMQLVQKRFAKLVWFAIGGLVVSGVYNWVMLGSTYKAMGTVGNALIGTKVLLALLLFVLVWARSVGLLKGRDKAYVTAYVHLVAVIILIGAVLRFYRLDHLSQLVHGG